MKLLVTRRDGNTELLSIPTPVTFSALDDPNLSMWQMHDAQGTDYFFNKDDGTYDGWGRAVSCQQEAAELLDKAMENHAVPTVKVQ